MLDKFSPTGFTMKLNPNYYDKCSLHVPEVGFPAYSSNANLLPPCANGTIDWCGISITGVSQNFRRRTRTTACGSLSAPYFSDNNVVGLFFNTTKAAAERPGRPAGDQLRHQPAAAVNGR